jgi:hypothetical protein
MLAAHATANAVHITTDRGSDEAAFEAAFEAT